MAHYLNVAHVLWIAENLGQNYDPNAPGMRLLAAAQVVDVLSFGSECGDADKLQRAAICLNSRSTRPACAAL